MLNKAAIVLAVCFAVCVVSSGADECIACDSSKDANCATAPVNVATQKCPTPLNSNEPHKCYVRIVDGVTYRGCFFELDQGIQNTCLNDTQGKGCFVCETKGCNNIVFPVNRLRCHSCAETGMSSGCYTGIESNAAPCKNYNPDDKCYIRKTAKSIERGCLSDTAKCVNPAHCFICEGDGCNNYAGNNTIVPTAPSSAVAWTSAIGTVVMAFVALKLAS